MKKIFFLVGATLMLIMVLTTGLEISAYANDDLIKLIIVEVEHGTVETDPKEPKAGDEVTLTPIPEEGYLFADWKIAEGNVNIENNKFIMPDETVKIEAIFEEDFIVFALDDAKKIRLKAFTKRDTKGNIRVQINYIQGKDIIKAFKDKGYKIKYCFYRSAQKSGKYRLIATKDKPQYINNKGEKGKIYFFKGALKIIGPDKDAVYATPLKNCIAGNKLFGNH